MSPSSDCDNCACLQILKVNQRRLSEFKQSDPKPFKLANLKSEECRMAIYGCCISIAHILEVDGNLAQDDLTDAKVLLNRVVEISARLSHIADE